MRYFELLESDNQRLYLPWSEKVRVGTTLVWSRGANGKREAFVENILEQTRPQSILSRGSNLILFEGTRGDGRYWYTVSVPSKSPRLHSGWFAVMRPEHEAQSRDWAERYWSGEECTDATGDWHFIAPSATVLALAKAPVEVMSVW